MPYETHDDRVELTTTGTNEQTNERTNEQTNERTNERRRENACLCGSAFDIRLRLRCYDPSLSRVSQILPGFPPVSPRFFFLSAFASPPPPSSITARINTRGVYILANSPLARSDITTSASPEENQRETSLRNDAQHASEGVGKQSHRTRRAHPKTAASSPQTTRPTSFGQKIERKAFIG